MPPSIRLVVYRLTKVIDSHSDPGSPKHFRNTQSLAYSLAVLNMHFEAQSEKEPSNGSPTPCSGPSWDGTVGFRLYVL